MSCQGCGADEIELCSCTDGYNAFTLSTSSTTIADPMTIAVSNAGQYTGSWAKIGQVIFIEGYGYYKVTASTSTSITVAFPPSPFVGGATYSLGSVDYDNSGSIPSGTKISPGGIKGANGAAAVAAVIEAIVHDVAAVSAGAYTPIYTKSLTAGSLSAAGDTLHIKAKIYYSAGSSTQGDVRITIGGVSVTFRPTTLVEPALTKDFPYMEMEVYVTYVTGTTCHVRVSLAAGDFGIGSYSSENVIGTYFTNLTYENLNLAGITWASANDIIISGQVNHATGALKLGFYLIENLQQI